MTETSFLIRLKKYLQESYQLNCRKLEPLDLGADPNTTLYLAQASDHQSYFLKLRFDINPLGLSFPQFLQELGLKHIIAPVATRKGELYQNFEGCALMLFPFIEGNNAYHQPLSDRQWFEFGQSLRFFHDSPMPEKLRLQFPLETYSDSWRKLVQNFQTRIKHETFTDLVAQEVANLLLENQNELLTLLERTETLALSLKRQNLDLIPCHADLHAGNLHLTQDSFYLVDWDTLILAPKERDLMFIGAGLFGNQLSPEEEIALFYQGYGETEINQEALSYFRLERIIQDIAVYCQELLDSSEGGKTREQSLRYLASNFLPGGTLELAYQTQSYGLMGN